MFNQRKSKRFSYKSRFQTSEDSESKSELEEKWHDIRGTVKRRGNVLTSLPALIVMLVAIFVLIYILEGYINN